MSCTTRGETILYRTLDRNIGFPRQDIDASSHFPYNTELQPRRLDYIVTRWIYLPYTELGDYRDRMRSDHEFILLSRFGPGPPHKQCYAIWGTHELRDGYQELLQEYEYFQADAHAGIATMARTIIQPAPRRKFKEIKRLKKNASQVRKEQNMRHRRLAEDMARQD